MTRQRASLLSFLALLLLCARPRAQSPAVPELLDHYAAGRFDVVEKHFASLKTFDSVLEGFRREAVGWIERGDASERSRRELVAATVALEAARAGATKEWKWVQYQPLMTTGSGGGYQPLNVLVWKAPPLLIEWACALFRKDATPRPVERWWQLAALSVAQRSEDPQFLVGDIQIGRGVGAGEIGNLQDEIKHLDHVEKRFPQELRFTLAQGVARDRHWMDDAIKVYRAIESDVDVGGEALMRLGAMQLRQRRPADAIKSLARAETQTRDPYVVYLARFFRGRALEAEKATRDAEAAYRGAVAAIPHAQSATLPLAALLYRDGRQREAQSLVDGMLAATPQPVDPWRVFVHADDRFWPQLVGRLRAEIRQ